MIVIIIDYWKLFSNYRVSWKKARHTFTSSAPPCDVTVLPGGYLYLVDCGDTDNVDILNIVIIDIIR